MGAPRQLHALHHALTVRPALALLAVAGMIGFFALATIHLKLDGDMAALLPGGPRSAQEAARLLSDFGVLDTFLVEVSSATLPPDQIAEQTERVRKALEATGEFASVRSAPPTAELFTLAAKMLPHRLQLLGDPAGELQRRLEPAAIDARLAKLKEQLANPEAIGLKRNLLADPLGLDAEVLKQVTGSSGDFEIVGPALMAKDLKAALVIALPKQSALSVDSSNRVLAAVEQVRATLPGDVKLRGVGGARFVAESSNNVKHDVVFNLLSSGLVLAAIFIFRFRGLRLFLLGSVPLALGVLGGLAGVALLKGRIHGLSLGFGAALVGIAVDYPIYLLNLSWHDEGTPEERLARATDAVWSSLWLGFLTTVVGFLLVGASEFPGLQELALFGGIGLAVAFFVTLVLVPPLSAKWGPAKSQPVKWAGTVPQAALGPGAALAVALAMLGGTGFLASKVRFDGNLRNLDAQSPQTMREHAEVLERFGLTDAGALAVVQGRDSQAALEANDALYEAIAKVTGVKKVRSVATLLPSARTQRGRTDALKPLDLDALAAKLGEAAERSGFSATAFDAFWKGVRAAREGELAPLTPDDLKGTMVGDLAARSLRCTAEGCRAISILEKEPGATIVGLPADIWLIDGEQLASSTVEKIPRQLFRLCGLGLLANVLMLSFAWRSLRLGILACAPCLLGLMGSVAAFSVLGRPLDLVSASGLVLVLGCGVDYGIFVLQGLEGQKPTGVEAVGVLLASTSTLAGFGTLAFATYPALASLGIAIGMGILITGLATLLVLPGLHKLGRAR